MSTPLRPKTVLSRTKHRPYPLPSDPWALSRRWQELLFMHWPLREEVLRPLIPPALALDTFDGSAWLGVVPFGMSGVRPRFLPEVPWLSDLPELNVRTYVSAEGKPGIWFFSLDAHNPIAVREPAPPSTCPTSTQRCPTKPSATKRFATEVSARTRAHRLRSSRSGTIPRGIRSRADPGRWKIF